MFYWYNNITSGVEKNNDTSKRNYSSNKHDTPGEIIRSDYHLNELQQGVWGHPSCVREKQPYHKRNTNYWEDGGIQAVRKRQPTGSATASES